MPDNVRIVAATEKDTPIILKMIQGLAEFEKMSDHFVATEAALREHLFGGRPAAEVLLGYIGDRPVGFALFFSTFSTFACRPGIYLEDLFIEPEWRGRGVGHRLLARLAAIGVERGCDRMQWVVLPWNEPAIQFYRRLGAEHVTEWDTYRLTGDALEKLARDRS